MSLLGGVAGPENLPEITEADLESIREPSKLLNQGTLLMLLVVVLGAGGLYAMRVTNVGLINSDQDKQAEARIEQLLVALTNPQSLNPNSALHPGELEDLDKDADVVLQILTDDPTRAQVPIDYIQKNPFSINAQPLTTIVQSTVESKADREAKMRQAALQSEFQRFALSSIISGAVPVAVIDNELRQVGDRVGQAGDFTVKKINADLTVELTADGRRYVLQMEKTDPAGQNRRR